MIFKFVLFLKFILEPSSIFHTYFLNDHLPKEIPKCSGRDSSNKRSFHENKDIIKKYIDSLSSYGPKFHINLDFVRPLTLHLSRPNHYDSSPRWESQSLYYSFDGKLVLACGGLKPLSSGFLSNPLFLYEKAIAGLG